MFSSAPRRLLFALGLALVSTAAVKAAAAAPLPVDRPSLANPISSVTFWGEPYPYGYAYVRPPVQCWRPHDVETFLGTRTEWVWVCSGKPIKGRY